MKEFKVLGGAPGRIQLKTAAKTYIFRVRSETKAEAVFLEEMFNQNLK